MPLRYINRFIAIKTLNEFDLNKLISIRKIYEILERKNKISVNDLGYLIGPILNAGGRLNNSDCAAILLSSDDENEIEEMTKKLINLNNKRKNFEQLILNNIDYKIFLHRLFILNISFCYAHIKYYYKTLYKNKSHWDN